MAPWVLGIWAEWLDLFLELGSTGNYLGNLGSKLIVLGIQGVMLKSKKINSKSLILKEKPPFCLIKQIFDYKGLLPPDPLMKCNSCLTCISGLFEEKHMTKLSFFLDLLSLMLLIFRLIIIVFFETLEWTILHFCSTFLAGGGGHAPDPSSTSVNLHPYRAINLLFLVN